MSQREASSSVDVEEEEKGVAVGSATLPATSVTPASAPAADNNSGEETSSLLPSADESRKQHKDQDTKEGDKIGELKTLKVDPPAYDADASVAPRSVHFSATDDIQPVVRPDLVSYRTVYKPSSSGTTGSAGNSNANTLTSRPTISSLLYGKTASVLPIPKARPTFAAAFDAQESDADDSDDDGAPRGGAHEPKRGGSRKRNGDEDEFRDIELDSLGSSVNDSDDGYDSDPEDPTVTLKRQKSKKKKEEVTIEFPKTPEDDDVDWESMRRFGMWDGVFARCLLNIFGVIMFLRLGWVVGTAGIGQATLVMIVSVAVTTITTLSLSAITTNGEVKGGGAYYLISRALGPEFGGSIGMLFGAANAIAIALYLLGFAETIVDHIAQLKGCPVPLTEECKTLFGSGGAWDIPIIGIMSLVVIFLLTLAGVDWVIKVQLLLLALLVACIFAVIIQIASRMPDLGIGFTGISSETFSANFGNSYTYVTTEGEARNEDFFSVLSIFFPAVTGIMAGANISGEIKNASYAIPWGTLLSILVSTICYIVLAWLLGASVDMVTLLEDNFIFTRLAEPAGVLVFCGIYAATLSSAIASLVGAPRIFQAVAIDRLFPVMNFLGKGHGSKNEPWNAYVLCFVIAFLCILSGNLDAIAPIITSFFILSYAMINYACFLASYTRSPGWRPGFRYYNKWVSLLGFVACMAIMFVIRWWAALVALFVGALVYKYIDIKKPPVNWGSARSAGKYSAALKACKNLQTEKYHIKTYRPQFLVLSESPKSHLVQFVTRYFKKSGGLISAGSVVIGNLSDLRSTEIESVLEEWREARESVVTDGRKIRGFAECIVAESLRAGCRSLIQMSGMSQMRPNIVVLGFKENWFEKEEASNEDYVDTIRDAFLLQCGVMITRNIEGLDLSLPLPVNNGTIDVWWLNDDGGLTLLVPYILTLRKKMKHLKIRVMDVITSSAVSSSQLTMQKLLQKFRIEAEPVSIPVDVDRQGQFGEISPRVKALYDGMHVDAESPQRLTKRTNRHLRMADIIQEYSKDAACVVISIPVPEIGLEASAYLSWLDCLSKDLPPTILLRGNQQNVLTWDL